MIGSTDSTRRNFLYRNCVRVTTRANARPSAVQPIAHAIASSSVFQATPQRVMPAMQPSPQIFSVNRRAGNAARANSPSLSWMACTRILKTGKNVNTAMRIAIATTVPATKASPLKRPRSARPSDRIMAKAVAVRNAPRPMPYCRAESGPNTSVSTAKFQPAGPIANPCTRTQAKPVAPIAIRPLARAARSRRGASNAAAAASSTNRGSSQARPCRSACSNAGALSLCDQLRSQATPSTVSCSAYHGRRRRPVAPTISQATRARRCGVITRYFGAELISFSHRSSSRLRVSAAPNLAKS